MAGLCKEIGTAVILRGLRELFRFSIYVSHPFGKAKCQLKIYGQERRKDLAPQNDGKMYSSNTVDTARCVVCGPGFKGEKAAERDETQSVGTKILQIFPGVSL